MFNHLNQLKVKFWNKEVPQIQNQQTRISKTKKQQNRGTITFEKFL